MKRAIVSAAVCSAVFILNGCGGGDPSVSVVDLDKVLDIFEKVLKEPAPGGAPVANAKTGQKSDANEKQEFKPLEQNQENAQKTTAFLKKLTVELNKAKLVEDHMGVQMLPSGAIEGFIDADKNGRKSGANEKKLFTVEVDHERSRLIATDDTGQGGETYRRQRGFRPGGFFMGYMIGSMMGRQNRYYSGGRARPRYGSMNMSKAGYHKNAVSSARSRARAARSGSRGARRGGSGGLRGGK